MAVTDRRTRGDWAQFVKELVDVHYPDAEKIVLVMDNLNTHSPACLYETFPPEQASAWPTGSRSTTRPSTAVG